MQTNKNSQKVRTGHPYSLIRRMTSAPQLGGDYSTQVIVYQNIRKSQLGGKECKPKN
jgi:hypothetical protein